MLGLYIYMRVTFRYIYRFRYTFILECLALLFLECMTKFELVCLNNFLEIICGVVKSNTYVIKK